MPPPLTFVWMLDRQVEINASGVSLFEDRFYLKADLMFPASEQKQLASVQPSAMFLSASRGEPSRTRTCDPLIKASYSN
jgi:hypothetical protein